MRATIKDIADKLNLSVSSVSRALNNKPGVSEDTRRLVQQAADEIGYSPNELARSLVCKRSNTIGVILPDVRNAYYSEILQGIVNAASKHNYTAIFCVSNWDSQKEVDYIQELQSRQVSGLIIKRTRDYTSYTRKEIRIPTVLIESWHNKTDFSFVELDDVTGGMMATTHLVDYGYRNIAFLGGIRTSRSCVLRREGYEKVLKSHDLPIIKSRMGFGEFSKLSGYKMAQRMLKKDPKIDAFFANNDVIALGALQYLDEAGIRVPEDVGVIGFDNIALASMPRIGLTTINQPKELLGKNAFELLLNEMHGSAPQRLIYQPKLIVRNTTSRR